MRSIRLFIKRLKKRIKQRLCKHENFDLMLAVSAQNSHFDVCKNCGKTLWKGGQRAWRERHGIYDM